MTCTHSWLVLAAFVVAITDIAFYESGEIICPGTTIKGVVNDDYCDCPDGKDEPGTAACPNGRFYCKNAGYLPHYITSSKVQDGICDCCDGSDEVDGKCENECIRKAAELNAITEKEIEEQEAGLKQQHQNVQNFITTKDAKHLRKMELEAQKTEKESVIQTLEARASDLQSKIDQEREKLKAEFKSAVETEVEAQVAEFVQRREAEIAQAIADKKAEQEAASTEEKPEGSTEPPAETEPEPAVDLVAEAQTERERLLEQVMNLKLAESESLNVLNDEKKGVEDNELRSARDGLNEITKELDEIAAWLATDFGPDSRFAYMHGQTYSYHTHEYEYKLTPFKEAKQAWTSIGDWEGWQENYTMMKFSGGQRCWGGPDRSLVVHLTCGADTTVVEIKEPAKCEYSMKLKTPGACSAQELENLKGKLFK